MKRIFGIVFALVLIAGLGLATTTPVLAGTIRNVPSVYPTIQAAIDAAGPGDTIMVAAGNYDAFIVSGKTNISIIGAQGATVTTANRLPQVGPLEDASVMAGVFDSANINIEGIDFDGTGVGIGWTGIAQVAAGTTHTVGLKADGTVVAVGSNGDGQCNVTGWTGITQVAAGHYHTVGRKSDGTVVAAGWNDDGQCNVGNWTNITQVAAGAWHTVGLKSNLTVLAVGDNSSGQCNVTGWTNIIQVAAGGWHTVGLKSDGTVVAVGDNSAGQCNVGNWTNITQVTAGHYHTVGRKSDGTVVAVGEDYDGQCNVSGWANITQVAGGGYHTVGLCSNGTVVAVGDDSDGQCSVSSWTSITQVAAGRYHTVGCKSDGTAVAVGSNYVGQFQAESTAGIAYLDSTGSISDLTVADIYGGALATCGVAIIGDDGAPVVNLSGVTIVNAEAGVAIFEAEVNLDLCTTTEMLAGVQIGWPFEESPFGPSTVTIHGSIISDNWYGVQVSDNSTVAAHLNNITGNGWYGLSNDGSATMDATGNWWGDDSGPYHPTLNPDGLGDKVSDNVDFEPWLEAEAVTETVTNGTVDAKDEADTEVAVTGTATVTVAPYEENPGGAPPSGFSLLGTYIDVYVPDTSQVTEIEIRLYYTDAELAASDIDDESSLRLDWWNGAAWVHCSDSGVNTASVNGYSGYMWAKIRSNTTPSLAGLQGSEFASVGYTHPTTPPGGGCFIATAAYGTDTAKELDILREFRDMVLLPNSLGAKLVSFYYKTSPPVANFISQCEVLRTVVRVGFVDPIVRVLAWTHALWSARGS